MAKATSKTRAANLAVPQDKDEAARFVTEIGTAQRDLQRVEADMNDTIAAAKEKAQGKATPLQAIVADRTEGLRMWCEANRAALTEGGKTKTADLGTGTVAWRFQRAKVTIRGEDDALLWLTKAGKKFRKFVRVKMSINREMMLDDEKLAVTIPGVSIGSDGESFVVEPFEADRIMLDIAALADVSGVPVPHGTSIMAVVLLQQAALVLRLDAALRGGTISVGGFLGQAMEALASIADVTPPSSQVKH